MLSHERLVEARRQKGFKTRRAFHNHLQKHNTYLTYDKLGQLERGEVLLDERDLIHLCTHIPVSADYVLFGKQESAREQIQYKLDRFSEAQCAQVLVLIDGHFDS